MSEGFNPSEYWEARLSENPDISGVGITIFGKGFNRWSYRSRRDSFIRSLGKIESEFRNKNKKQLEVADIGSGTGFYIDIWKAKGYKQITGFDITDISVQMLSKKYVDCKFIKKDISDHLEEELIGKFDIISCMDVVFHIVDPIKYQQAFVNFSKMLKPGGALIFSENWIPKEMQFNGHWFVMKTPEEGMEILNKSNLAFVEKFPFMQIMDPPRNTKRKWVLAYWKILIYFLRRFPALGSIAGSIIYPFERILKRCTKQAFGVQIFTVKKEAENYPN